MALNFLPVAKPSYSLSTPPTSKLSLAPTSCRSLKASKASSSSSSSTSDSSKQSSPPHTPGENPSNRPFAETNGMPWAPSRHAKSSQSVRNRIAAYDDSPLGGPGMNSEGRLSQWLTSRMESEGDDVVDVELKEEDCPARRLFFTAHPSSTASSTAATTGARLKARRARAVNGSPVKAKEPGVLLPPLTVSTAQTSSSDACRGAQPIQSPPTITSPSTPRTMNPPSLLSLSFPATSTIGPTTSTTTARSPVSTSASAVSSLLSRRRSTRRSTPGPAASVSAVVTAPSPTISRVRSLNSLSLRMDGSPPPTCCSSGGNMTPHQYTFPPISPLCTSMGRSRSNSSASSTGLARLDCRRSTPLVTPDNTAPPSPTMLTRLQSSKLPRGRGRSRSRSSSSVSLSTTRSGSVGAVSVSSSSRRGRTMTPDYFGAWEASVPLAQRRGRRVEILRQKERERNGEDQPSQQQQQQQSQHQRGASVVLDAERKRRRVIRASRRAV